MRLPRLVPSLAMTPCVVILNTHSVILNVVKNLEVSEAVDGGTNLEILRCTQDDIEPTRDHAQHIVHSQRGDASTSLSMTLYSTSSCERLTRLVPSLAMTPFVVILSVTKNLLKADKRPRAHSA